MKAKFYTTIIVASVIACTSLKAQTNTFPSTGKVGIGTTSPNASSLLEIKSTNKGLLIPRMTKAQRDAIGSPVNGLLLYQTDNYPGVYSYNGTNWGSAAFWRKSSLGLLFYSDGNVGIGLGNPHAKLQITGGTPVGVPHGGYEIIGDTDGFNMALDPYEIQVRYNGSATSLDLNPYGGSVYAGSYSGSTYGLVGLGYYEGLYGESVSTTGIGTYGYSATYHGVYGYTGGGTVGDPTGPAGVYGYNASTGYGVGGYCVGGSGVYANSENYIGIYAVGNASYYAGYFSGNVYSTGSYLPSDLKLKQNVKDISSAMDIINQLHPKQYEYRQDGNYKLMNLPKGNRFGLIADDVEKVLPNLVKESEFNSKDAMPQDLIDPKNRTANKPVVKNEKIDFKALNYTEFIPLLIKGMQEQQAVIDKQQQQIDQLKQLVEKVTGNSNVSSVSAATLTSAALLQNIPNPYKNSTTIQYNLPAKFSSAQIVVTDNAGKILKQVNVSGVGKGSVNINSSSLATGNYNYSLWIDGKLIETKQMILAK